MTDKQKKSRKERIADEIAAAIGAMTKGPFYVNRAMQRGRGNKKPRYEMTAADYKRLDDQRKHEDDRRKRHADRGL